MLKNWVQERRVLLELERLERRIARHLKAAPAVSASLTWDPIEGKPGEKIGRYFYSAPPTMAPWQTAAETLAHEIGNRIHKPDVSSGLRALIETPDQPLRKSPAHYREGWATAWNRLASYEAGIKSARLNSVKK